MAGFDLPALDLGNSNSLAVGEPVVIVGSPRGLEGTVTAGILSSVRDSGNGFKVLQTDAAVNPGNSGGPLVNGKGLAIGVVSFKLRSSEGLNFAVPINYVKGLLNELHEPLSLDRMRRSLAVDSALTGPSLKETLDWLKGMIPLATDQYGVTYSNLGPSDTTERHISVRFESCTIVFDKISRTIPRERPSSPVTYTGRYTIPLGALYSAFVYKRPKPTDDLVYKADGWVVPLQCKSRVFLSEEHEDWLNTRKE